MSYFPISLNLRDKRVLIIGGGSIATFKFSKIDDFHPSVITVVADKFSGEFVSGNNNVVVKHQRKYEQDDLCQADIVIVAIDDHILQKDIYQQCKERKIICNCVDFLECCDFIFPAYIKKGDVVVAINTNGTVPGFSAEFKIFLEKLIPENINQIMCELKEIRSSLPPGKSRMQMIRTKAKGMLDKYREGVLS